MRHVSVSVQKLNTNEELQAHTTPQFLASSATCFGLTNQRQAVFYKHLGNISTLQYAIHTASVCMCFTQ